MPAPRAVCRWRFIGSSERTEPIAPDQSARHNGNSHRTLIAPAIGVTAIADCLLPANWPRNCEYGPIFDPLRPDLKERLRSATPRFLAGPRMQFHCMRYWMRKQTPLIAFAAFMLSAGIAHAQFLFWPSTRSGQAVTLRSSTSTTTGRQTLNRRRTLDPRTFRRARSRSSSRLQTNGSRFLTTGP